ncbi:receptor-like protein EIX2 [Citrus clementina]|nr:receptor-like protein EIX2 [Citrus x clementina]
MTSTIMSVSVALLFLELFTLVTMINISFCIANSNVACIDSERQALLKLKQDLNDPSNRLASWNIGDGDCCAWDGVVCNNFTGHVLQLNLGNPDPNYGTVSKLVGKINPSLVDLTHLIHLDLSGNDFHGIQIPKYLGSLKNLRYLNLSRAKFAGVIPYQLGNLSNLQYLDLSENYESQVESFSWLSGLSLLEHLDLSDADLSKATDWLLVTNSLSSLKVLKLSYCELHHFPPSSSANFSSLKTLDLSKNQFNNSLFQFSSWVFGLHNLVFFDLSGNQFQGKIPNGLGNLTFLRHLDLSYNEFNSAIPGWLSKLNDIEFLSLQHNSLLGTISSMGLENLTSIKTLDLSLNYDLAGKIPTSFVRLCKLTSIDLSFVKLSQDLSEVLDIFSACGAHVLESLVLRSCQFSGHLTNQLGQFKSLNKLQLRNNSLSGPLPSALGELTYLTYLDLSRNSLNGSIPLSLGQILSLEYLDLSNNLLNGSIPLSLGKFSHLEYLDFSNNRMSRTLSENHFVNLTKLTSFSTSGNPLILQVNPNWVPPFQLDTLQLRSCHLGPHFPSWLHSQKHLSDLDISNTRISDTIPRWFWNSISQYKYLNLSSNQIYGEIPNLDFDNRPSPLLPPSSGILDFSNNGFSGSIFHLICNGLKSISYLQLSKNYFSGDIPDCWMNWPGLGMLNLGNNNLTGSLPASIGTLSFLWSLNLRNNRLSGVIPASFQNCSGLVYLDMDENEFVGNIPTWMGERFSGLSILILRSNKFHGYLPIQLCRLTSLQILDVANNNLSGTIPRCISNFTAMATTDSSNLQNAISYVTMMDGTEAALDASVVTKGFMVEYDSILNLVRSIDISKNNFSGEIPMELTNLKGLQSLNLSHNFFSRKIPEKIGNMKSIESLDFSANQLSGEIPQSMSSLSFLNHLNLSNNHLTGKIPSSTQLQSLDSSCFAGNNLCGAPLPNCTGNNPLVPEDPNGNGNEDEDEVDWLLYVSVALGFVVGFWCFIGPLLVSRRWRYKYCHFLDGFMDEFGCFVRRYY